VAARRAGLYFCISRGRMKLIIALAMSRTRTQCARIFDSARQSMDSSRNERERTLLASLYKNFPHARYIVVVRGREGAIDLSSRD